MGMLMFLPYHFTVSFQCWPICAGFVIMLRSRQDTRLSQLTYPPLYSCCRTLTGRDWFCPLKYITYLNGFVQRIMLSEHYLAKNRPSMESICKNNRSL